MSGCPNIIIGQPIFGDIAQLGERCVRNAEVTGSNPAISTNKKETGNRPLSLFFAYYRLI